MTINEAAQDYLRRNWSCFPVGAGKKPLVPWNEYRQRLATPDEVNTWGCPALGISCGKLSNLSVIDIDTQAGYELFQRIAPKFHAPIVHTPRGGRHYYCQWNPNYGNNVKAVDGIDLRAEGGFVVCPPSTDAGKAWTWDEKFGPDTPLPLLPDGYCELVYKNVIAHGDKTWEMGPKMFTEGQRNNDLFHVLYKAAKGGMENKELLALAKQICRWTGLPEHEGWLAAKSAHERATRPERNVQSVIKEYVDVTDGDFFVTDLFKSLDIMTKRDKDATRQAIHRLRKAGYIEKSGKKDGVYRKTTHEIVPIAWEDAPTEEYGIALPLGLNKLVKIFPKSIIVFAGVTNHGKTALSMEVARLNVGKHRVVFHSSEMDRSELRERIDKREDTKRDAWRGVEFIELGDDLPRATVPGAINIFDYLEDQDEIWKASGVIRGIFDRLDGGVAVINIQKNNGSKYGRGGSSTAQKARLYITVDNGLVEIVKGKNKKVSDVDGLVKRIKIVGGWKILEQTDWHFQEGGGK